MGVTAAVTFDSNVWRPLVSPDVFQKSPDAVYYHALSDAIREQRVAAYLAESVFTLEALKRRDRMAFFASYKPDFEFSEGTDGDHIRLTVSIGPSSASQVESQPTLDRHFQDALRLGLRLLRVPRLASARNPALNNEHFAPDAGRNAHERAERFGACACEIEDRGCGIAHVKMLGLRHAPPGRPWQQGIAKLPDSEWNAFAKAVAEWADGDAIAAHYAYGNDWFCTHDEGISAGKNSVMSPDNREWLRSDFGIDFVTPPVAVRRLESNIRR